MALFFLVVGAAAGCATVPPAADETSSPPNSDLAEEWGVEVLALYSSAHGYLLDFRYKVLDAEKAAPLFVRKTKPILIDQKSGAQLSIMSTAKSGPLRSSNIPQAGRGYTMLFGNPREHVKRGDRVSIVIGAFRVDNLVVQ